MLARHACRRWKSSVANFAFTGNLLPVATESQSSDEINARMKDRSIVREASKTLAQSGSTGLFTKKTNAQREYDPSKDSEYVERCQAAYQNLRVIPGRHELRDVSDAMGSVMKYEAKLKKTKR
eukprot:GEMP01067862.1.p2 GENE.GEMP01067862.1~~GEMP01067862.1.p2  ORF type:complete len:123 (+),score=19.01 GEMP01067862.1:11-379(+)